MSALIPMFLKNAVAALIIKKAEGKAVGLLASKTQWGATTALGGLSPEIFDLIGRAYQKDPEAIGRLVLIVGAYLMALIGRWMAGRKAAAG